LIGESQLITWSSLGPTGQFTDTYQSIRENLRDKSAPFPQKDTNIFLQGSYRNDTNVFGDSDVDIVMCHTGAYYRDLSRLPAADRQLYDSASQGSVQYGYSDFKRDVTSFVRELYDNVRVGNKALYVPGNANRRNTDVLVSAEFRRYHEFRSFNDQRYDEGVSFFLPAGTMIENFPKQHSENCTAKHQATSSWFKPTVRIFKNMRNTLISKGLLHEGTAPSYFIEGMLFNVPNEKFGGSFQQTWVNCFDNIVTTDQSKLVCASGMHWLVRNDSHNSWPAANFLAFTSALKKYWEA
jgi:hypothetical protein